MREQNVRTRDGGSDRGRSAVGVGEGQDGGEGGSDEVGRQNGRRREWVTMSWIGSAGEGAAPTVSRPRAVADAPTDWAIVPCPPKQSHGEIRQHVHRNSVNGASCLFYTVGVLVAGALLRQ